MGGNKLFELFKERLRDRSSDKEIIDLIKGEEDLVSISNSYCTQCGNCCNARCANIEQGEDGLAYCLLHNLEGHPNGKKVPDYDDIHEKMDPKEFAKPLVCHTYAPHLVFLSLESHDLSERRQQELKEFCPGADDMLKDYETFLNQESE